MTHIVLRCTGAGMVQARKGWLQELGECVENSPLLAKDMLGGWVSSQVYGHGSVQARFASVEERLFWRGLIRKVHTVGVHEEDVGVIVRKIVDGYVRMWKVRCTEMGRVKEEARELELTERRAMLVANGYLDKKVGKWGLVLLRKKTSEIADEILRH